MKTELAGAPNKATRTKRTNNHEGDKNQGDGASESIAMHFLPLAVQPFFRSLLAGSVENGVAVCAGGSRDYILRAAPERSIGAFNFHIMNSSELFRFRVLGLLEGASFVLLLLLGMPLKYLAGNPVPVKFLGSVHGGLFVLYVISGLLCAWSLKWPLAKTFGALVAAIVPLGPFVLEHFLKKEYGAIKREKSGDPELRL